MLEGREAIGKKCGENQKVDHLVYGFQEIPSTGRKIVNLYKDQTPNIITKPVRGREPD